LIVNGGTLTNSCHSLWRGIEVEGNSSLAQNTTNQGRVTVTNGAVIENAFNAIRLIGHKPNNDLDYTTTGGIVEAQNSTFRNNWRAIEFMAYHNMNGSNELDNISYITNCVFETTGELVDGTSPYAFV